MMQMHVPAFRFSVNPLPTVQPGTTAQLAHLRARTAAGRAVVIADRNGAGRRFLDAGKGHCNPFWSRSRPVARIVAVIIIIATGLALAFGDTSGGFRKLIQIVFAEHRVRRVPVLPVVLQLLRRGGRMSTANDLPGFEVPLHRSPTEPILMGGAPRTVAIANGTLAAAVGLGLQLWIPGVVFLDRRPFAGRGERASIRSSCRFARHIKHKPLLDV